jgi:alkylation response protein AidB-like acyl-CoA dehydrogenase
VDFQFNEEQLALQNGLRDFCSKRATVDQLKAIEKKSGFDADLWQEIAQLGVFAIAQPLKKGGMGKGSVESAICLEELGRRAIPGPLIWSCLAASLVDGVSDGSNIVSGLDLISSAHTPYMIENYEHIDTLLVLKPSGVFAIDPKSLQVQPVEKRLDPFTPVHYTRELPPGRKLAGSDVAARIWLQGACLAAGQLLGIAEETLLMACEYAKQREQFDKPIGQFQSIKHMLADMYVLQEIARSATYAAAATIDDPRAGNLNRAVSSAKINAGEAAMKNARACIQILGGMGYTWEIPAHYYLKRCWVLSDLFGSSDEHARLIADSVADEIDL